MGVFLQSRSELGIISNRLPSYHQGLFAPEPSRTVTFLTVPGVLVEARSRNTSVLDAWTMEPSYRPDIAQVSVPHDQSLPLSSATYFPNQRWRRAFHELTSGRFAHRRPYFLDYLCNTR